MAKSFVMPEECPYTTGLGDVVARMLKKPVIARVVRALTGVDTRKPCGGCEKRRKWLNEKVPLGKRAEDMNDA